MTVFQNHSLLQPWLCRQLFVSTLLSFSWLSYSLCDYCDWLFIYFRLLIIFIFLWFISIFTYLGIQFSPKVLYLLCKLYKSTSLFLYVLAKIVYVQILNSIDVFNSNKESKKCFIDSSFKIFCLLYLNLDLHVKYPYEKNTPHTTLPKYQYKFR